MRCFQRIKGHSKVAMSLTLDPMKMVCHRNLQRRVYFTFYILYSKLNSIHMYLELRKRLQTRRVDDQRPADEENQTRLQHQIDVPIPTFKVLLINVRKSQRLRKRKAEDWRKSVKLQQHGQVPLDGNSLTNGPCTDIGKRQTSYFDFFASDLLK